MRVPEKQVNGSITSPQTVRAKKGIGEVFTVCTHCNRVLLPSLRKNSAPPSIRVSREEDEKWMNFEDISQSLSPIANLSHGLCASCFQRMDALIDVSSPILRRHHTKLGTSPRSSSPTIARARSPRPDVRVLVVDDNKLQRTIHKRMVEKAGFCCDLAVNGDEAVAMARDTPYALILMDLMMEGDDGWTTTRRIRKTTPLPGQNHPRIVAVTGMHVDSSLISDCCDAGMDDIVQKPVSSAVLSKVLTSSCAMA